MDTFHFFGEGFNVRFDRVDIASGQWWRLLTGHFDHLGWNHFFLNAVFLVLLLVLFKPLEKTQVVCALLVVSSLMISMLMWAFSVNLQWYVGLSGCLYALMVYGVALDVHFPLKFRLLTLCILTAKVASEQLRVEFIVISDFISGPVAVDAHLYGAVVGLVLVGIYKVKRLFSWPSLQ
jgi:rhomboid family GlyGly-CTERM serine protease